MARIAFQVIVYICLYLIEATYSSEFKLSDSKLLLPFNSYRPVNYTLTASDGTCYIWTSSSTDVVSVTPIISDKEKSLEGNIHVISHASTGCSNAAIVTAVWQAEQRATAFVQAHNKVTGHVVKCDVIVDKIHHLEIETTTQELYLHDAPEALVARAYDEAGNTFSSLVGLPFDWYIKQHSSNSSTSTALGDGGVLRFITWTESEYSTPKHIENLEYLGLQGFMQLVIGLKSGTGHVSVSVKENVYRNVIPGEVKLLVRANAHLAPHLVYLMPHALVDYHVYVTSQGSVKEVSLPSPQFTLVLSQPTLATLDSINGHTVTALNYGETEITLVDENLKELTYHRPTSLLHIVAPGYLQFQVNPTRRWVLQVNQTYQISVDVLDHNSHRLHCSPNMRIEVTWPSSSGVFFDVLEEVSNGSWFLVKPTRKGLTRLVGRMNSVIDQKTQETIAINPPIEGHQDVEIYDPIKIIPPLVILPWSERFQASPSAIASKLDDSTNNKAAERNVARLSKSVFTLSAIGGSGEYSWSLSKPDTVSDSLAESVAVTTVGGLVPVALGRSVVIASDIRNHYNWASADVEVVNVVKMSFLASRREVIIPINVPFTTVPSNSVENIESAILLSDDIVIPLALYDMQGRPMAACLYLANAINNAPLTVSSANANTVKIIELIDANDPNMKKISHLYQSHDACLYIRIRGVTPDHTDLIASLHGLKEATKVTIAAYHPASFINPASTQSLMVWGAKANMMVINGPQRWLLDPSGFYHQLQRTETNNAEFQWITAADMLESSIHLTASSADFASETAALPQLDYRNIPAIRLNVHCPTWKKNVPSVSRYRMGLLIGNKPTPSNLFPASSRATVMITCSLPKQMRLLPLIRQPIATGFPPCPLKNNSIDSELPLSNSENLRVEIYFLNEEGDEYDRSDSVKINVKIVQPNDATKFSNLVTDFNPKVIWPKDSARAFFQVKPLELGKSKGSFVISATATLEDGSILENNLKLKWNPLALVTPRQVMLFNHPKVFQDLLILHGSGHFYLTTSSLLTVNSLQEKTSSEEPLSTESLQYRIHFKETTDMINPSKPLSVVVHDLCFPTPIADHQVESLRTHHQITATVNVLTLSSIEIRVNSYIQMGNVADVLLLLRDVSGNIIPTSLYNKIFECLHFRVHKKSSDLSPSDSPDDDLWNTNSSTLEDSSNRILQQMEEISIGKFTLNIAPENSKSPQIELVPCLKFRIRGIGEGSVTLRVSAVSAENPTATQKRWVVYSAPKSIEVFSPLRFQPQDMLLLVGSERTLEVEGGPRRTTVGVLPEKSSDMKSQLHSVSPTDIKKIFSLTLDESPCFKKQNPPCSKVEMNPAPTINNVKGSGLVRGLTVGAPVSVLVQLIGPSDPLNSTLAMIWNSENIKKIDYRTFDKPADVYSEASGTIRVVTLTSIRIQCPVNHLLVGESAPLYLIGSSAFGEVDPLSLTQVEPRLVVEWHLNGQQTSSRSHTSSASHLLPSTRHAKLSHLLEAYGIRPNKVSFLSGIRLTGLQAGPASITAIIKLKSQMNTKFPSPFAEGTSHKLTAQVSVQVVGKLQWSLPSSSSCPSEVEVLMTPLSGFNLETTLDKKAEIRYELLNSGDSTEVTPLKLLSGGYLWAKELHFDHNNSKLLHGYGIVRAESHSLMNDGSNSFINQTIILSVHVLPVSFIMLHSRHYYDSLRISQVSLTNYASIPAHLGQGGPYSLEVGFHDYLGRRFHAVSGDMTLNILQNQYDYFDSTYKIMRAAPMPSEQAEIKTKPSIHSAHIDLILNSVFGDGDSVVPTPKLVSLQLSAQDTSPGLHRRGSSHGSSSLLDYLHLPIGQVMESVAGKSINFTQRYGLKVTESMCIQVPFGVCQWRSLNPQALMIFSTDSDKSSDDLMEASQVFIVAVGEGQGSIQCTYHHSDIDSHSTTFVLGSLVVHSQLELPKWQVKLSESSALRTSDEHQIVWVSLYMDKPLQLSLNTGGLSASSTQAPACGPKSWSSSYMMEQKNGNFPFTCHLEAEFQLHDVADADIWLQNQLPSQMDELLRSELYIDQTMQSSTNLEGSTIYNCFIRWYFQEIIDMDKPKGKQDLDAVKKLGLLLPKNAVLKTHLRALSNRNVANMKSQTTHLRLLGGYQIVSLSSQYVLGGPQKHSVLIYIAVGPSVIWFLQDRQLSPESFIQIQFGEAEGLIESIGPNRHYNTGSNQKFSDPELDHTLTELLKSLSTEAEIWSYKLSLKGSVKEEKSMNIVFKSGLSGQRETISIKFLKSHSYASAGQAKVVFDEHTNSLTTSLFYDVVWLFILMSIPTGLIWIIVQLFTKKTVVAQNVNAKEESGLSPNSSSFMSNTSPSRNDFTPRSPFPGVQRGVSPSRNGLWSQGYGFSHPSADFRPMRGDQIMSPAYRRGSPRDT